MMNTVIINLSPRRNGTSAMLASMCKEALMNNKQQPIIVDLYIHLNNIDKILNKIKEADAIIFCGPCYINQFPADTIYLLESIMKNPNALHGQSVYGIIQGGMPYVHTHVSGLRTLELFCEESNLNYKGGFVMGLGAYLNGKSIDNLPNGKKMKKCFDVFLNHIANGERSPDCVYERAQLKLPGVIYQFLARRMNKSINKDLMERGIDYTSPSPYWNMIK